MKKYSNYKTILVAFLFISSFSQIFAQTFECRVHENDKGYLVYEMRETSGTNTPTTSTDINDITFVIRYPSGAVDMELLCSTNDYKILDGLGGEQTHGGYDYHYWNADAAVPVNPPHDWVVNEWEEIAVFKVTGSSGSATFEVAPDGWDGRSLNWNQTVSGTATDFTPTINGSGITYSYPTTVYTFVWTGANTFHGAPKDPTVWEIVGNWNDECNNAQSDYPWQGTENVYVPDVSGASGYFPELTGGAKDGWYCNNMFIDNNAHVTVPDLSGSTNTKLTITGNLKVKGKLYLPAKGYATVSGSTEIDNAAGIEVQADATGVGSFIDNGTITYGSSGSGKVQTYLANGASAGNFYFHTVGPTVDVGGLGGAHLSDFNLVNGSTYAYKWDETQPLASAWQNIYSNNYLVTTGDGIALSTTDATNHTLEMTGNFITGNTNPPALTFSNNHYELISNPYPSSFDFDAFATDPANNGVIQNKYWVWDPAGGNYVARSDGSGGTQHLQVGQAFFVETKSAGTVTFKNSFRTHSGDAFRETNPNELTMKVSGGSNGYKDELIVRFVEEATFGYDSEIDAYKVNSMYEDATQIESIAEDGSELAINFLPVDALAGDMVSVPVNFQCGYTADYTFDFEGIESFENGNEIWLEDKFNNDSWIYLNNNPHYTFTAATYQPHDRFILHFFGPTSVNENSVEKPVEIFSYRQYAYVKKNEPGEIIKKVSVYNMSGEELFTKKVLDQPINKLWVSEHVGYYFVKVVTDKNIYTGKVFIFK